MDVNQDDTIDLKEFMLFLGSSTVCVSRSPVECAPIPVQRGRRMLRRVSIIQQRTMRLHAEYTKQRSERIAQKSKAAQAKAAAWAATRGASSSARVRPLPPSVVGVISGCGSDSLPMSPLGKQSRRIGVTVNVAGAASSSSSSSSYSSAPSTAQQVPTGARRQQQAAAPAGSRSAPALSRTLGGSLKYDGRKGSPLVNKRQMRASPLAKPKPRPAACWEG